MPEGRSKLDRLRGSSPDPSMADPLAEQLHQLADEVSDTFNYVESCNVLWNELRDRLGICHAWLDDMEQRVGSAQAPVDAAVLQVCSTHMQPIMPY